MKKAIVKLLMAGTEGWAAADAQTLDGLTLSDSLDQVEQLFGGDCLLQDLKSNFTVDYYNQSEWGYRLIHSPEGSIHLALNFDGRFHPEGYYAQACMVAEQIEANQAKAVLEVGSGKGFNSLFLAEKYPTVQFTGIDLTPLHVKLASQKASALGNLEFKLGDFNRLDLPDQSVDVLFGVECFCYAQNPEQVLKEVFRVLRPGGQCIAFDGYLREPLLHYPQDLQKATSFTEVSMAVQDGFIEAGVWKDAAIAAGFEVEMCQDLTDAVQPNLRRLRKISLLFFNRSLRARILTFLMPKYLVRNAIAGLLMPFVFNPDASKGSLGYYAWVLRRPAQYSGSQAA